MKEFEEKTIHTKKVYDGKIIKLRVDDVSLPDGKTSKRELLTHQGGVAVIPLTEDGKILFVKQYRKAIEKTLIEIPAGLIDEGEDPQTTAIRELEEETGYTTKKVIFVTSFYPSPGYTDELNYIYFTDQLELLQTNVPGDDDEFIEVVPLTLAEAKACVQEGTIHDAKTIYAILYLETLEMK